MVSVHVPNFQSMNANYHPVSDDQCAFESRCGTNTIGSILVYSIQIKRDTRFDFSYVFVYAPDVPKVRAATMSTDRLRQQHELHWLLTFFYRGHPVGSAWKPSADHHQHHYPPPSLATSYSNQQQQQFHQHHPLVRWHFNAKPPRLKYHQRQPLEWTKPNGHPNCLVRHIDGCGGNVTQQLTCEWLWHRRRRPNEGWHRRQLTLTCFVVGRSLFVVRMDLKWFRLSVEFRRMATAVNGQRTVDVFVFRVDTLTERRLEWSDEDNSGDDSLLEMNGGI